MCKVVFIPKPILERSWKMKSGSGKSQGILKLGFCSNPDFEQFLIITNFLNKMSYFKFVENFIFDFVGHTKQKN